MHWTFMTIVKYMSEYNIKMTIMENPLLNRKIAFSFILYIAVYLFIMIFIFIDWYDVEVDSESVETWDLELYSGEYIRWKCNSGDPLGLNVTAIDGDKSESLNTGVYYGRYHWGEYKANNDATLRFNFTNEHKHAVVAKIEVNYNMTGIGLILQTITFIILGIGLFFTALMFLENWKRKKNAKRQQSDETEIHTDKSNNNNM